MRARLLAALAILLAPSAAHAWNYAGHRVIASVAYRQLDEGTRAQVAEALNADFRSP